MLLRTSLSGAVCKTLLMESYFLEGKRAPENEQNALCHTIQDNCCSINDLIKIHGDVTSTVEPALQSYREKMLRAITDVVSLNGMLQKLKFTGATSPEQSNYCVKSENEFREINFERIADHLRDGFDKIYSESKDYHIAFYCSLCDFKAQQAIDTAKKVITLSPATCMTRVVNNKSYIRALNVDLINYFKAAQKFLDCVTYDNYYEFPFLFKEEGELADNAKDCIDKTSDDPKSMPSECNAFCEKMSFGGISSNLEGDAIFLDKISDYFSGMVTARNRNIARKKTNFKPFEHLDKFEVELTDPKARKLTKSMLFPGRMLEEKSEPKKKKKGPPGPGASIDVLVQYYGEYYDEIVFETNPESKEILKLQADPFNLRDFKVTFSSDDKAINLPSYFNGMNFEISKTELTKHNIVTKKKKVEIDPYLKALCLLADPKEVKSIAEDIKLTINLEIPKEFISKVEKTLSSAKVVNKEIEELVDSVEAKERKKEEETAKENAAEEKSDKDKKNKEAKRQRLLRKRRAYKQKKHRKLHNKHRIRHSRRYSKTYRRRTHKNRKHMSRKRKLEALIDFDSE